jgi:hypothetical protein
VERIFERALSIRNEIGRELQRGVGVAESVLSDRLADAVERAATDLGGGDGADGADGADGGGVHLERSQLQQLQEALRAVQPVGEVGKLQLLTL